MEKLKSIRCKKECPICYIEKEKYIKLICGHLFCTECLQNHIKSSQKSNTTCPLCRKSIDQSLISKYKVVQPCTQLKNNFQSLDNQRLGYPIWFPEWMMDREPPVEFKLELVYKASRNYSGNCKQEIYLMYNGTNLNTASLIRYVIYDSSMLGLNQARVKSKVPFTYELLSTQPRKLKLRVAWANWMGANQSEYDFELKMPQKNKEAVNYFNFSVFVRHRYYKGYLKDIEDQKRKNIRF